MRHSEPSFYAHFNLIAHLAELGEFFFICTLESSRIFERPVFAFADPRPGAGTKLTGYVHPKALAALAEIGIQHAGRSKLAASLEFCSVDFDLVVTVCDSAAEECPLWLGKGKKVHHSFPDPARVIGTEAEIMAAFRAVRDDIARKIPVLLING